MHVEVGVAFMILMTGASGFLGSHVFDLLWKSGCEVDTIGRRSEIHTDLLQSEPPWSRLPKPDALLHCAGLMQTDERSVIDGAIMTANLLSNLPVSVRKLVLISSAYVYAPAAANVSELTLPNPADTYGYTKLMVESLFQAIAKSTDRDLIILRPCAIYGPNDPHRKVVTAFVSAARNGKPPTLRGRATFPRDYIHVLDAARCVKLVVDETLLANAEGGQNTSASIRIFNVCTGSAWSAKDLARLIGRINPELNVQLDVSENDGLGYRFDPSLATRDLGFTAEITMESGIKRLLAEPSS